MLQSDQVRQYIEEVCAQIRHKQVHTAVREELCCHIEEQRDAYIAEGSTEDEATSRAVAAMGDPVLVGGEFDRVHRPQKAWSVLLFVFLLLGGGILLHICLPGGYWQRHAINACVGLAFFAAAYFTDYQFVGKYAVRIYVGLLLGIACYMPFAPMVNGLPVFVSQFGGAFALRSALILFLPLYAGVIYQFRNSGYGGILCLAGILALPGLLLNSAGLYVCFLYIVIGLCMLFAAILRGWFQVDTKKAVGMLFCILLFGAVCMLFIFQNNMYILQRLETVLHPEQYEKTYGYQMMQIKEVLSNSVLWGKGSFPAGDDSLRMIEEMKPGNLLTLLAGIFGFLPVILVMLIFCLLFIRIFRAAFQTKNQLGFLLGFGFSCLILFETLTYFAFNMGLSFLFSPFYLPFVSYGGSNMLFHMLYFGLALSAYRIDPICFLGEGRKQEKQPFIGYQDGTLSIRIGRKAQ